MAAARLSGSSPRVSAIQPATCSAPGANPAGVLACAAGTTLETADSTAGVELATCATSSGGASSERWCSAQSSRPAAMTMARNPDVVRFMTTSDHDGRDSVPRPGCRDGPYATEAGEKGDQRVGR